MHSQSDGPRTESFEAALEEVAYAYERTLLCREHLARAGISPRDLRRSDDFARIPTTEKADYRVGFPAGVLASGFTIDDARLYRSYSSGSTGEQLLTLEMPIVFSGRSLAAVAVHPLFRALLEERPRRHVRLAAPNCSSVVCANPSTASAASERTLSDGTLVLRVYHDLMTTPDDVWIADLVEIEEYRPQLYYADPAHLSHLARFCLSRRFKPYIAPIVSTYSLATQIARRQIKEAFGAQPFTEVTSMSELGWVAAECPHGTLHANTSSYYLEWIRGGVPAPAGVPAELVATTIDRGCTPRIRYRTRDVYTRLEKACPCGSAATATRMEGRLADCFFVKGELRLTPKMADDAVGDPGWLDAYRIHQASEDRFSLEMVTNDAYAAGMEKELVEHLRERLGAAAHISVRRLPEVSCEPSGKFAICSSQVGLRFVESGGRL